MILVCYGDSNTYGYDPRSYFGERYDPPYRWVDILAARTGWDVRNHGMNGQEIPRNEPLFPQETEYLILMLGTNDLLQGASAEQAADRMEAFLQRLSIPRSRILLIAPPPMKPGEWVFDPALIRNSRQYAAQLQSVAQHLVISFANAGEWDIPMAYDGVHFTEEGHVAFARGLLSTHFFTELVKRSNIMNQLKRTLLGELIGLARATDGNEHLITDEAVKTVRACLFAAPATEQELSGLLDQVAAIKREMVPDCFLCANPCGRTAAFDLSLLQQEEEAVRSAKEQLLEALQQHSGQDHLAIFRSLTAVGIEGLPAEVLQALSAELTP